MNELEWLTEQRPETAAPDEETTRARPRAALLRATRAPAEARAGRGGAPRRSAARAGAAPCAPRGQRGRSALAAPSPRRSFAVAIVVVAGALPSGDGPARRIARARVGRRRRRWC